MKNKLLQFKSWLRYTLNIKSKGKGPGSKVLNNKNFYTKEFNLADFDRKHPWMSDAAPFHPKELDIYVDQTLPYQTDEIILPVKHLPKTFIDANGNEITIPIGRSVLFSKEFFKYGYFEADIILPIGNGMCASFWLTGKDSWPPEIDMLESFYRNDTFNKFRRLQSNLHYKEGGNAKQVGSMDHPIPISLGYNEIKIGVWWTPSFIRFYYNGHLVREITNKNLLIQYNQPMHLICSSKVELPYFENKSTNKALTFYKIKNLKYIKTHG